MKLCSWTQFDIEQFEHSFWLYVFVEVKLWLQRVAVGKCWGNTASDSQQISKQLPIPGPGLRRDETRGTTHTHKRYVSNHNEEQRIDHLWHLESPSPASLLFLSCTKLKYVLTTNLCLACHISLPTTSICMTQAWDSWLCLKHLKQTRNLYLGANSRLEGATNPFSLSGTVYTPLQQNTKWTIFQKRNWSSENGDTLRM